MMFKFFATFSCILAFAAVAFAQNVIIAQPAPGTNVTAGTSLVVQLAKPTSLTGSEEVSVVIGAFPCTSGVCPGASEVLGTILYSGSYSPAFYPDSYDPYENFTVTVPSAFSGLVQLGVAHFYLLGAGLSANLQVTDVTLNAAASN